MSRTGVVTLLASIWLLAVVAIAYAFADPFADFLLFGAAACLVVTLPMLRPDYDLVSPWSMLALAVYIGCGIRGAFIATLGSADLRVEYLFTRNQPPDYFFWPSVAFLAALTLMAIAYVLPMKDRPPREGFLATYQFNQHVGPIAMICAGVGFVAFYLFAQRTGGSLTGVFSAKRTTIPGLELTGYEGSHGVLRAINQLSAFAFWLMIAKYALTGVSYRLFTGRGLFLVALFINAALLPVYASSRAEVAYILIVGLVIQFSLASDKRHTRRLLKAGAVTVALVAVLTFWRTTGGSEQVTGESAFGSVDDALVFNRSFVEIPKTAHIMHAVPEELPYTYGSTVLSYVTAPIPRSVWPDKPLVSPGPIIGATIYGNARSGVPPGAVAESYWALGLFGLAVIPLLLGRVLRLMHRWLRTGIRSPAVILIYATAMFPFGANAIAGSIGSAGLQMILAASTAFGVLFVAGGHKQGAEEYVSRPSQA